MYVCGCVCCPLSIGRGAQPLSCTSATRVVGPATPLHTRAVGQSANQSMVVDSSCACRRLQAPPTTLHIYGIHAPLHVCHVHAYIHVTHLYLPLLLTLAFSQGGSARITRKRWVPAQIAATHTWSFVHIAATQYRLQPTQIAATQSHTYERDLTPSVSLPFAS